MLQNLVEFDEQRCIKKICCAWVYATTDAIFLHASRDGHRHDHVIC